MSRWQTSRTAAMIAAAAYVVVFAWVHTVAQVPPTMGPVQSSRHGHLPPARNVMHTGDIIHLDQSVVNVVA